MDPKFPEKEAAWKAWKADRLLCLMQFPLLEVAPEFLEKFAGWLLTISHITRLQSAPLINLFHASATSILQKAVAPFLFLLKVAAYPDLIIVPISS